MTKGTFATAINCMDGRTQLPVMNYLKKKYGVDYVDAITEPGPNRILAEGRDLAVLNSIRRRLEISVLQHGSRQVVIVGHHDCAGNPVAKEIQLKQIAEAIKTVKGWELPCQLSGLWVDGEWQVHEV